MKRWFYAVLFLVMLRGLSFTPGYSRSLPQGAGETPTPTADLTLAMPLPPRK